MLHLAVKAFWPAPRAVPGDARRHRPELRRGHRVPRPDRREVRPAADRRAASRTTSTPAASVEEYAARAPPQPAADGDPAARHPREQVRRGVRRRPARRGEGPRQGARVQLPRRVRRSGTRATSAPSCGTSTTAATARARTSASSRCRTGPSSTSGPTSATRRSSCPSLYYAHKRKVVERDGMLLAVNRFIVPEEGENAVRGDRPLPHDRRRHLHRLRRVARRHPRGRRRRGRGRPAHRARRDPRRRPHQRGRHGRPQEGGLLLNMSQLLRIATAGSVDDGKSTLIGRLLYDTQGDLRGPAGRGRVGQRRPRPRGPRPRAAHRRPAGRARAGHHHRRRLPLLRDARAQVHHRRHPRPHPVHAQHGHRCLDRRRRADPDRRPQRRARAVAPARVPRHPARHPAPDRLHQQDGPRRLLARSASTRSAASSAASR